MSMNPGLYSSDRDDWWTPPELFAEISASHGPFDLDVCATKDNAKCERYFTREDDGLAQEWTGRCWMNPPYGREIGKWMKKAWESGKAGAYVVCLVPARTDTRWWHDYAAKASHYYFLRGRVRFIRGDGKTGSAPFPSAVVIFGKEGDPK